MSATPPNDPNRKAFRFLQTIADDLSSGEVTFPTFLDATLQVRVAMRNPNLSAEELARAVMGEPLISLRLLRMANSAALNPAGAPVTDVKTAVVRVGFNQVRAMALAVAMEQLQKSKEMAPYVDLTRQLWQHSVEVAAIAFVLARQLSKTNPDEAMLTGLVHDIGQFYLLYRASQFPDVAADLPDLAMLMGDWHTSVGHALLTSMGTPEEIVRAVADHEVREVPNPPRSLSDVVFVANRLSLTPNPFAAMDPRPLAHARAAFDERPFLGAIAQCKDEMDSLIAALRG